MVKEHEIVAQVYGAKGDVGAADELVRRYLPFIRAEAAKFLGRVPVEGRDDELGIAMFAFHEAVLAYKKEKGAFLPLAARVIRSRLIDHRRREARHEGHLSLDESGDGDGEGRSLLERLDAGQDEIELRQERSAAKAEIGEFAEQLALFDLTLTDIAESCPRQSRTLEACHRALAYAKGQPLLLETLVRQRRLPIGPLSEGSGVPRKTLERHRDYMVAILLAYTNGFEIIRGHLQQLAPAKGGQD